MKLRPKKAELRNGAVFLRILSKLLDPTMPGVSLPLELPVYVNFLCGLSVR